jgi:hypothetical protein
MVDFTKSGGERGFDPSSFQIAVVMNLHGGIRLPLWTKQQGGQGNSAALAAVGSPVAASGPGSSADLLNLDLPIVTSVSVELSLGHVGKVTVDIGTTYDLGMKLLDSQFFVVGNLLEVQIGYQRAQRFLPWVVAQTAKPSISINADDGMTATLNGEGGGFSALRGVSNKTFEGKSYKEIIEAICAESHWDVEFSSDLKLSSGDPLAGLGINAGGVDPDGLTKKRDMVSQANMTDWFFVQHIAYAAGCHVYMGPAAEKTGRFKLVVTKRKDSFSSQPRYRFVSRGRSDFITSFPALSFESESEFVWLPGGAVKVSTQDINPQTKKTERHDATQQTSSEPTLGDAGSPNSAEKTVDGALIKLTSADGTDRTGEHLVVSARDHRGPKELSQSHRDELAVRGGVTAKLTSFGIPELLPGDVVQLDALGIFNGLYGINSLTHTANDTEWTMSMDLINNATAAGIFEQFFVTQPEESKTNTGTVDESSPQASGSEDVVAQPQQ